MTERLTKVPGIRGLGLRALDALTVAPLSPSSTRSELLSAIRTSQAKRDRLIAGVQLADTVIPGLEGWCARLVTNTADLPVAHPSRLATFAGGEHTIFSLYEHDFDTQPKAVLKINRATIGLTGSDLVRAARTLQREYEAIRTWYRPVDKFVPDEHTIILNSHLLGLPAVATIQSYVDGPLRGIFEDYKGDQLLTSIRGNTALRTNFTTFGDLFLSQWYQTGTCIDILGPNNVSVVVPEDEGKLLLIDPHVMLSYESLSGHPREYTERLDARIRQIEGVMSAI